MKTERDEMDIEKLAEKAKSQLPKAEPKDAAPAPSAETKKIEAEVKKVETPKAEPKAEPKVNVEEQAAKDEEILSKKDEELDDVGKKRKAELHKVAEKSNVQKRIDELTGKIKELENDRNSTKSERDTLRTELDGIKKQLSMTPQDKVKEKVKGELASRKEKYLAEDKTKAREERREMAKEDIDEWLLEDYEGASEWITRRTLRRHEEEKVLLTDAEQTAKAETILDKQDESAKRVQAKYPELTVNKRLAELKAQGKTSDEIKAIVSKENPKYALCVEIYQENPEKYMIAENAPELIVQEMEKRLAKKPVVNDDVENIKKELAALRAENERLKGLDAGITSNRQAEPHTPETEIEKTQFELAKKVGLDPERLKKRIAERAAKGYDQ